MILPEIYQDADGSDYGEGFRERMYHLAAGLSAPTILEIGLRGGNSLRIWAAAAASNGGTVYSIDCCLGLSTVPSGCVLIIQSSQLVNWKLPLDLLYIDGDHGKVGFHEDLTRYYPHVKSGGHILIHDITNQGHYRDMIPVLNTFCREQRVTWETWPSQCGMAHFRKPE